MTLRSARMIDTPRLVELLKEQHAASRYADTVNVDEAYAKRLIAQFIQRNGGSHDGGTIVAVVEEEGVIVGFVAGILDRVYSIGDQLVANDVFLVATEGAPAMTARRLLAAYITWAERVPNCAHIKLSWTDVLPSGERMDEVYQRMGFRRAGGIYERDVDRAQAEGGAA